MPRATVATAAVGALLAAAAAQAQIVGFVHRGAATSTTRTTTPPHPRGRPAATVPAVSVVATTPTGAGADSPLSDMALVLVVVGAMLLVSLAITAAFLAYTSGFKAGGLNQLDLEQQKRLHRQLGDRHGTRRGPGGSPVRVGSFRFNRAAYDSPPKTGQSNEDTIYSVGPQAYDGADGRAAGTHRTLRRTTLRAKNETPAYLMVLDNSAAADSAPYLSVLPNGDDVADAGDAGGSTGALQITLRKPPTGAGAATAGIPDIEQTAADAAPPPPVNCVSPGTAAKSLAAAVGGADDSLVTDPALFEQAGAAVPSDQPWEGVSGHFYPGSPPPDKPPPPISFFSTVKKEPEAVPVMPEYE